MSIKIINLTKQYGNLTAVDKVNLEIENNQIFALLGLNGAGKTTLIKILSCLTRPTSGDAFILGKSILKNPLDIKQQINIAPQETSIAPNLTVFENLIFISQIYGFNKIDATIKSNQMLKLFELEEKKNVLSKKLSGGQQRRLGIAMAIISDPKILFLDEPTLGLDIVARRSLWKIINKIKENTTIILTTHYLNEVEHLANKVAIMNNGKIVANDTVDNIVKNLKVKNFEDAFMQLSQKEGENV